MFFHLQLNRLVILHGDLKVDRRVGDGLVVEADVEAVLPEAVGGDALVGVVVGVQYGLNRQTRLPRAVTNLETLTPLLKPLLSLPP